LSGSRVALSLAGMTMSESVMIFRWLAWETFPGDRLNPRQFSELQRLCTPYSLTPRCKSYKK
jgi:hypothetical protein